MSRNKPHSFEESPHHPLMMNAVWKYVPAKEIVSLKKNVKAIAVWQGQLVTQWRDKWLNKAIILDPKDIHQLKLAEIGAKLRQTRLNRQLSLEAITLQTQIPHRLLEAIELGDLDQLPEPIYVRGMIKQFADCLGLDGNAIARELPTDISPHPTSTKPERSFAFFQIRPIHLYFFYLLVVILSVQGLSTFLRQSASETSLLDVPAPPLPPLTQSLVSKPSATKPVSNRPTIPPDEVWVEVRLNEDSWLKVIVDGKSEFEGILPKGTRRSWKAQKEVKVRAGNAGGVEVMVNQQKPQPMGKLGQIQEMTYKIPSQS